MKVGAVDVVALAAVIRITREVSTRLCYLTESAIAEAL